MVSTAMKRALLLGLFALSLDTAHGQTAQMAGDVNATGPGAGGSPRAMYAVPGKLFFFGNSIGGLGAKGFWVTDGTSAGTTLLTDLCPGGSCSFSPTAFLGDVGGTVLFIAESEDGIVRLWRSDGTRAGTYPLTGPGTGIAHPQISPGSILRAHAFFKGAFYFRACDTDECKSYRSDGSAAGTVEIPLLGHELVPAGDLLYALAYDDHTDDYVIQVTADPAGGSTVLKRFDFSYRPERLTAAGSRLFFTAFEGAQAQELWVSDGTAAGTRAVTDFVPSQPFSGRDWLKAGGNRVWFVADDVIHGEEIWVSDGTPQGTRRATDFGYDIPFSTRSGSMEEVNGRLVFMANDGIHPTRLWTTTGTPESVVALPVEFEYHEPDLKKSEGRLFFQLTALEHGGELWTSDGTVAGTRLVTDLCPGSCTSLNYSDQVLPWPGGVLLMGAHDGVHGREIWLSDGTRAGTRRITEFEGFSAVQDSQFAPPVSFAGRIWFATESFFEEGGLWSTDGDPPSTRLVAHLGRSEPTSQPRYLTAAGGRLYFAAHDGAVDGLWSTLGPPETTVLVKAAVSQPSAGGEILGVTAVGSLAFFSERAYLPFGPQKQLWRTDGTPAGTLLLLSNEHMADEGVEFQGKLYIPVWPGIWTSDGTVAGTGSFFSHPMGVGNLAVAGGALYFSAGDELWRTDGTVPGTLRLKTIPGLSYSFQLATSGPLVFFKAANQLWKTDGTPEGTVQVAITGLDLSDLTPFEGGIAFLATSGNRGLFVSDGTADGTVLVKAFRTENRNHPTPSGLTAFAGRLYLSADDGVHGSELWSSDGTAAGTVLVRDIAPGWRSSYPRRLTVAGGRLFFVAGDGVHGGELWVSDGTNTRLVQDLNPYANPSEPEQLTVAGDRLYFTADDGVAGREVWSFSLTAGPGCQPTSTRLCLNGGRFQVEAAWRDFQGHRGTGRAVELTADTGSFWFFSPSNVEAVVKVLDGRGLNDHFWVFYGALSSVEYYLTVTDTQTGAAKRYYNPPGQLASVGDTNGFGPLGAFSVKGLAPLTFVESRAVPAAGPCQPTPERLCLNGGRFAVEAAWKDFQGKPGTGKAVNLTSDTGWFWFFDAANLEVMIKVLDGTSLNGRHWVFYGALSSVEYTITVTDTQTGTQKTYKNPSGRLASVADTNAF